MKNKIRTIGLILSGVGLTILLYCAYDKLYAEIYNKGYNESAEFANLYADLINEMINICKQAPTECGEVIVREIEPKTKLEMR